MPRVSPDQVSTSSIPIPPIAEQHAIAAFLDRETEKIDALVAKVREAIERLKELRTALISAAVTGPDRRARGGKMTVNVSERAFEDAIETALLRHGESTIAEERYSYVDAPVGGYQKRDSEDYDRSLCLIPRDVVDFILATQPRSGGDSPSITAQWVEERFLKRLAFEIGRRGALDVLPHRNP